MPKKLTEMILKALRRAGVSIESDDLDKVKEGLEDLELPVDELVDSDHVLLDRKEWRQVKDDLVDVRKKRKSEKQELDDLRTAMDAGDSDNARKAKQYKTKLEELEPQMKELADSQMGIWEGIAGKIPEKVKDQFHFAEKGEDGKPKPLSFSDLVHNLKKVDEYQRIGVLEGGPAGDDKDPPPDGPTGAPKLTPGRKGSDKLTQDQMAGMSASQLLESGYKPLASTEKSNSSS